MAAYSSSKQFIRTSLVQVGEQLALWLAVLANPLSVVSGEDLDSEESLRRSYRFFLFIFTIVFLLRVPFFDIFLGMDMHTPLNLLALFVLNAVSIAAFVLVLYVCAKILFGRGSLRSASVTGIYLTAFWPFFMLTSYLSGVSLHLRAGANAVSEWWFMEPVTHFTAIALLLFLFFYLIIKCMPAIKYVHTIGNIRAIIICGFCYVLAFELQNWLVLELLSGFMKFTG